MPRYKLTIEYDGSAFHGWQCQDGLPTVQQLIKEGLFKLTGETISVEGSGRTDAGVHALGQVAHIDLHKHYPPHQITGALTYYLHDRGVSILSAEVVDDRFHARFSATARQYLYRIINRRAPIALEAGRAWHVRKPLNLEAMQEAAKILVGHHDFTSFRSIRCQSNLTMRTIDFLTVEQQGDLILVRIQSKAFLHNQVRIIVGTLKLVGEGRWTIKDVQAVLDAKDRTRGGPTAPPEGLYFAKVIY